MNLLLWTVIAILIGLVAILQFIGVRALEGWGVSSSRAVIGLRTFNLIVVIGMLVFVFSEWMKR